jgi:hypothetical protein
MFQAISAGVVSAFLLAGAAEAGFGVSRDSQIGDITGDGRKDIYARVERDAFVLLPGAVPTVVPLRDQVMSVVLEQHVDGSFSARPGVTAEQWGRLRALPVAGLDLRLDDYNADATTDLLINNMRAVLPDASDLIVFRQKSNTGYSSVVRAIDKEFVTFNEDFIGVLMMGGRYVYQNLVSVGSVCSGGTYVRRPSIWYDLFEQSWNVSWNDFGFLCTSTIDIPGLGDINLDAMDAWSLIARISIGEDVAFSEIVAIFESVYGIQIGAGTDRCAQNRELSELTGEDCRDRVRIEKVVASYMRGIRAPEPPGLRSDLALNSIPAGLGVTEHRHLSVYNRDRREWYRAGPESGPRAVAGLATPILKGKNGDPKAPDGGRSQTDDPLVAVPVAYVLVNDPYLSTADQWAIIADGYDAFPYGGAVNYCLFPEEQRGLTGPCEGGYNSNSFAKGLVDLLPGVYLEKVEYLYRGERRIELFPLNSEKYPGFATPVPPVEFGSL